LNRLLQEQDLNHLSRISSVQSAKTLRHNLENIVDIAQSWDDLLINNNLSKNQNVKSHLELR